MTSARTSPTADTSVPSGSVSPVGSVGVGGFVGRVTAAVGRFPYPQRAVTEVDRARREGRG